MIYDIWYDMITNETIWYDSIRYDTAVAKWLNTSSRPWGLHSNIIMPFGWLLERNDKRQGEKKGKGIREMLECQSSTDWLHHEIRYGRVPCDTKIRYENTIQNIVRYNTIPCDTRRNDTRQANLWNTEPSQAKPTQAKTSQHKSNQAKPSQPQTQTKAKPSSAKPGQARPT